jgi:uroporphyrinogen-III synthase
MPEHSNNQGGLENQPTHLLWFRPLSPLNYTLPTSFFVNHGAKHTHLPIDVLTPKALNPSDFAALQASEAWFLSSPTAAHCLALALRQANAIHALPRALSFVGQASLDAWQAAGGALPQRVVLSSTGESMGLYEALVQQRSVCVLRAQMGREDLPLALRNKGVSVSTVAVYQKTPNLNFKPELNAAVRSTTERALELCFTSSDQVGRVLSALNAPSTTLHARVWASHPRVKVAAVAAGFKTVQLFQV